MKFELEFSEEDLLRIIGIHIADKYRVGVDHTLITIQHDGKKFIATYKHETRA
jgi:hypothetical protein